MNKDARLTLRLPAAEDAELRAVCRAHGISISAGLRLGIALFSEMGRIAWLDLNPDAAIAQLGSAEQVAEERQACEASLHQLLGTAFLASQKAANAAMN